MPRQRIDLAGVIDRALSLVDEVGLDELSLARVAEAMGVQAPALYNHVDGVDGLRQAVVSRSARNLADTLRDAAVGRSGSTALEAVAAAYREFARAHPGQYAATLLPLGGSLDSAPEPESDIVDVLARILESYGLEDDRTVHAARIVRSAIHGFVTLEAVDAFVRSQDRDESFRVLIQFVTRGMATLGFEQVEP
jgi:AcrR family transcriptional regulator